MLGCLTPSFVATGQCFIVGLGILMVDGKSNAYSYDFAFYLECIYTGTWGLTQLEGRFKAKRGWVSKLRRCTVTRHSALPKPHMVQEVAR